MAVTASDVKALATELASVADATITTWIAIVERQINRAAFGVKADDAVTYLTSHYVTINEKAATGASGTVGTVTSRKVGDVSTSFSTPANLSTSDAMLSSTMWGQLYLNLRSGTFADRRV